MAAKGLSPWDSLDKHKVELTALAESDPATKVEIAQYKARVKEKAAGDAAKEAIIADTTGGLDRETVMAMAEKILSGGYWPEIFGDGTLAVYNGDRKIIWAPGADGWSSILCTRGTRDDAGAGYGANQ